MATTTTSTTTPATPAGVKATANVPHVTSAQLAAKLAADPNFSTSPTQWIAQNPGTSLVIAAVLVGGGLLVWKLL